MLCAGIERSEGVRDMPDNSDSQHWRDLAEKAREQAKRVTESRFKQRLLRHADAYESLVEQIEMRRKAPHT
jgi:hypothetical protein